MEGSGHKKWASVTDACPIIHRLELELQCELDLPFALRGTYLAKIPATHLEGRDPASEVHDWMIKQVDELRSELQPLPLCDKEIFVHAHVCLREPRSTEIARGTGAERVRGWQSEGAGVPPLDEVGTRHTSNRLQVLRSAGAVRSLTGKKWARPAGAGWILEPDRGRYCIPSVPGNDSTQFPVADNSVDDRVHAAAILLATTYRKLVGDEVSQNVGFVVIARTPVRSWIVNVLPARQAHRCLGTVSTPGSRAKETRRVSEALGVGVRDLALQSVGHALFQGGLERIVGTVRVGGSSANVAA